MKVREGSGSSSDPAYRGYLRFTVSGLSGGAERGEAPPLRHGCDLEPPGYLRASEHRALDGDRADVRQRPADLGLGALVEGHAGRQCLRGVRSPAIGCPGQRAGRLRDQEYGHRLCDLCDPGGRGEPAAARRDGEYRAATARRRSSPGARRAGSIGQSVTLDKLGVAGERPPYAWSFGDGTTPPEAMQANPVHQYASAGTFTVSLTVSNANGSNTRTRPAYITIGNPPVASLTATPASGTAPLPVAFDGTGSSGANLTYAWDFGDPGSGRGEYLDALEAVAHLHDCRHLPGAAHGLERQRDEHVATDGDHGHAAGRWRSITLAPIADAQVYGSSVNSNYGTLATLRTRENSGSSGTYRSYVKFNVTGTGGSGHGRQAPVRSSPTRARIPRPSSRSRTPPGPSPGCAGPTLPDRRFGTRQRTRTHRERVRRVQRCRRRRCHAMGLYTFALKSTSTNSAIYRSK